jgi:hypothetical protein
MSEKCQKRKCFCRVVDDISSRFNLKADQKRKRA